MKNNKQNRIKFLREQAALLEKHNEGDLYDAINQLTYALFQDRNPKIVKTWKGIKRCVLLDDIFDEDFYNLKLSWGLESDLKNKYGNKFLRTLWGEFWSVFDLNFYINFEKKIFRAALEKNNNCDVEKSRLAVIKFIYYFEMIWTVFIAQFFPELPHVEWEKRTIEAFRKINEAGGCLLLLFKGTIYVIPFSILKRINKSSF